MKNKIIKIDNIVKKLQKNKGFTIMYPYYNKTNLHQKGKRK
jgi:hypothetical protein